MTNVLAFCCAALVSRQAMELIEKRRERQSGVVKNIIGSLTDALEGLNLDTKGTAHLDHDALVAAPAYSLQHRDPSSALHRSLLELYKLPFPSMAFVAIDGEERMYCTRHFEKRFFTVERANHLLLDECMAPKDIFARYVAMY